MWLARSLVRGKVGAQLVRGLGHEVPVVLLLAVAGTDISAGIGHHASESRSDPSPPSLLPLPGEQGSPLDATCEGLGDPCIRHTLARRTGTVISGNSAGAAAGAHVTLRAGRIHGRPGRPIRWPLARRWLQERGPLASWRRFEPRGGSDWRARVRPDGAAPLRWGDERC